MNKVKVISFISSYLHGAGVSTMALASAMVLSKTTESKVLLVNLDSTKSMLEKYIQNDVEIKHSIDDIWIYKDKLSAEILYNYSDIINERLHLISKGKQTLNDEEFLMTLIDNANSCFDIVIFDMGNRYDRLAELLIERSEEVFYVTKYSQILWDEASECEHLKKDNVSLVFNSFPLEYNEKQEIYKFRESSEVSKNIFVINYDIDASTCASFDAKLYTHISQNIKSRIGLVPGIRTITDYICMKCAIAVDEKGKRKNGFKFWKP